MFSNQTKQRENISNLAEFLLQVLITEQHTMVLPLIIALHSTRAQSRIIEWGPYECYHYHAVIQCTQTYNQVIAFRTRHRDQNVRNFDGIIV